MTWLVTTDAANRITGLYSDADGYAVPPPEALPVTDDQGELLRHGFAGMALVAGEVLPAAPSVAEAKETKVAEIEAARDAACNADAVALGYTWQADARSQTLLSAAINLAQAGLPLPTVWRSADNVNVPVTALADLLAIAGVIAQQTQAAYSKSWLLKAQVAAATTVAEVAAVVW